MMDRKNSYTTSTSLPDDFSWGCTRVGVFVVVSGEIEFQKSRAARRKGMDDEKPAQFQVIIPRAFDDEESADGEWPATVRFSDVKGFAEVLERARTQAAEAAQAPAILINAPEAARLLGISVDALYMRISRGQVPGVVKTGRRTQFHRERLIASLAKRAAR
jgi:predicted DNA-binding transcriptional regulator AlpA